MDTKSSAGAALVKIQDLINDAKCFEVVRDLRWPEGVFCLHCGNEHVIKFGRDETQEHGIMEQPPPAADTQPGENSLFFNEQEHCSWRRATWSRP